MLLTLLLLYPGPGGIPTHRVLLAVVLAGTARPRRRAVLHTQLHGTLGECTRADPRYFSARARGDEDER